MFCKIYMFTLLDVQTIKTEKNTENLITENSKNWNCINMSVTDRNSTKINLSLMEAIHSDIWI